MPEGVILMLPGAGGRSRGPRRRRGTGQGLGTPEVTYDNVPAECHISDFKHAISKVKLTNTLKVIKLDGVGPVDNRPSIV